MIRAGGRAGGISVTDSVTERETRLGEELGEVLFEGGPGLSAHDALDNLSALEDLHRGYSKNVVFDGEVWEFVNVELDDVDLVGVCLGDGVENGGHRAARTTPGCPEVDNHGLAERT